MLLLYSTCVLPVYMHECACASLASLWARTLHESVCTCVSFSHSGLARPFAFCDRDYDSGRDRMRYEHVLRALQFSAHVCAAREHTGSGRWQKSPVAQAAMATEQATIRASLALTVSTERVRPTPPRREYDSHTW